MRRANIVSSTCLLATMRRGRRGRYEGRHQRRRSRTEQGGDGEITTSVAGTSTTVEVSETAVTIDSTTPTISTTFTAKKFPTPAYDFDR